LHLRRPSIKNSLKLGVQRIYQCLPDPESNIATIRWCECDELDYLKPFSSG
jgi:hypothetical protein